ncbi:hypothetical protein [Helicobacter monodelphidis]|uniref:hypothetical protein n=1 Tax=Helicobacter sp. 15-1451 TaxID=2004995 RepID=UPI0011BEBF97|nr:hypothetical protein [Helicobacter sp. 15-1451]
MKKIALIVSVGCSFAFAESFTRNLDNVLNMPGLGDLSGSIWDIFNDKTGSVASVCYDPDLSSGDFDACSVLQKYDNLSVDVCKFVPDVPYFKKKKREVGFGGLVSLCESKQKKFEDISSQGAIDAVSGIVDYTNIDTLSLKLPNGLTYDDFLRKWSFQEVISKKDSLVGSMAVASDALPFGTNQHSKNFSDNQSVLFMLKDYAKSLSFSPSKSISAIKKEDLKAPRDLREYEEQRNERVKQLSVGFNQSSIQKLSSSISTTLNGQKLDSEDAQNEANKIVVEAIKEVNNAKAQEIESALRLQRNVDDMAFPTQAQVDLLKDDLRPKMVAKIREQQLREANLIASIHQKYKRYEEKMYLVAEKAVIMNEKFDKEAAQKEIDSLLGGVK